MRFIGISSLSSLYTFISIAPPTLVQSPRLELLIFNTVTSYNNNNAESVWSSWQPIWSYHLFVLVHRNNNQVLFTTKFWSLFEAVLIWSLSVILFSWSLNVTIVSWSLKVNILITICSRVIWSLYVIISLLVLFWSLSVAILYWSLSVAIPKWSLYLAVFFWSLSVAIFNWSLSVLFLITKKIDQQARWEDSVSNNQLYKSTESWSPQCCISSSLILLPYHSSSSYCCWLSLFTTLYCAGNLKKLMSISWTT